MKLRALFSIAVIVAPAAGCSALIGIEDIHAGDAPDAATGAGGADASTDRATTGGSGGAGGASGAAGAPPDAPPDAINPGTDAPTDVRGDTSADMRTSDVDAGVTDTALPDGGAPDTSTTDVIDAPIGNDVRDGSVADNVADTINTDGTGVDTSADVASPDAPIFDTGAPDQPTIITVTGHIIDYWRHPLSGVLVTVGAASTTTDGNGQFSVSGVSPPYDVLFTISTIQNNTPAKYGWLYKGLTRTDPTLQVGRGLPERMASTFNIHVDNVDFNNLPATETVNTAFGGVDGMFSTDMTGADVGLLQASWFGPTTASMTGHGLHWVRASSTTLDLPTAYLGYDAKAASLTDSNVSSASFNLANSTITSGTLTGSVTAPIGGGQRENNVFLRFGDNAVIQLAQDATQPTTFSYLVPTLQGGTVTVAASTGDWYNAPYAVAHKDGLVAGQSGVALTIPVAPSLIAPSAGSTGVNQSTLFRWSGAAKVYLWAISFTNEYKGFFVVTTEKQGQIATYPDGPAITSNAPYTWWVETHGSYQNVDEATGTDGMLDTYRLGTLGGAARGDGTFASSEENGFTSAP